MSGVKQIVVDGKEVKEIPAFEKGSSHDVVVIMGK